MGEKNSSSELSRDFKGLHFPEANFNLRLFSSSVFLGCFLFCFVFFSLADYDLSKREERGPAAHWV